MAITPTIKQIVMEARADRLSVTGMLEDVRKHARHYGNRLEFEDAIELVRLYADVATEGRP